MIPVYQTRHSAQAFGNCFEACLASILELPLGAVPDRAAHLDHDRWADLVQTTEREKGLAAVLELDLPPEYDLGEVELRAWLAARGLAWVDTWLEPPNGMIDAKTWLEFAETTLKASYWIGHTRGGERGLAHATVWHGARLVHNPARRGSTLDPAELGKLHAATVLVAGDPALLARRLQPLPDVRAELERVEAA